VRYAFIEAHRTKYPIQAMCELLEVSRSGYHAWRGRGPSERECDNTRLLVHIRAVHAASHGSYGSPRVHRALRAQGEHASLNRVRRLMKRNGIAARHRRKFRATTDSGHRLPVAPNLLERDFTAERPDQVWLADVSYLWTDEGCLYPMSRKGDCYDNAPMESA
jgi:putative transposase